MEHQNQGREDHSHHEDDSEGVDLAGAIETGQELFGSDNAQEDQKVIHCPKCHKAEKATGYAKAATVFSLGAFLLSCVSLALQFFHAPVQLPEEWNELLKTLQNSSIPQVQEETPPPAAPEAHAPGAVKTSLSSKPTAVNTPKSAYSQQSSVLTMQSAGSAQSSVQQAATTTGTRSSAVTSSSSLAQGGSIVTSESSSIMSSPPIPAASSSSIASVTPAKTPVDPVAL